jgi:hypothetical protein
MYPRARILLHPDAATEASTKDDKSAGGGEGGEVSKLIERMGTLEAKLEKAEIYRKSVEILLSNDPDPSLVPKAIRTVYAEQGYNEQQLDELVERWQKAPESPPDGSEDEDEDEDEPKEPKVPKNNPNDEKVTALEQQLQALTANERKRENERIRNLLKTTAASVVDKDPEVGKLLAAVRNRSEPDEADKEVEQVRDRMIAAAERTLANRVRDTYNKEVRITGNQGAWDDSWVQEASTKVGAEVVGEFRPAIGDPSRQGRSTATEVETSVLEALKNTPPVKEPLWEPGKDVSELQKESHDWTKQELLKVFAGAGQDATKV